MNILVLHGLGEEKNWISSWEEIELMFPKYDKHNSYLVHNCYLEIPDCVKTFPFDAIIMMSTFLDWVKRYKQGDKWLRQYDFLMGSCAKKVVFSQDDYWLSEVRDAFYTRINADTLFPVCPPATWSELYPTYFSKPRNAKLGYTIYLTEKITSLISKAKPWNERKWDVIYRASGTPTYPNRLGYVKATIGETFKKALGANHGLNLNISTSKESFISGSEWYDFIADAKAILGSNSGSSVNIRNHEVVAKLTAFKKVNPEASVDEIEMSILEPSDINKNYTGISPRNVEAAMLGTLQILVPGEYSGIMKPYEHYVPLLEDGSNANEVLSILSDEKQCERITRACREAILGANDLYAKNVIEDVLHSVSIQQNEVEKGPAHAISRFSKLIKRYHFELKWSRAKYCAKKRVLSLKDLLKGRLG